MFYSLNLIFLLQAILRKAKSKDYRLYIKNNIEDNPDGNEIFKKLLILPLLPPNRISEGVTIIKKCINGKFINEPKIQKKWLKFMSIYFEKEWMNKITPAVFSVFMLPDRTNNYLESYHRTLNATIRTKPTCTTFVGKYTIGMDTYLK